MKTRAYILTALTLAAAMSFASCNKEQPDPVKPVITIIQTADAPKLALPQGSCYMAYISEPITVEFTASGEGVSTSSVTAGSEGNSSVSVNFDKATGKGKLDITLNKNATGSGSEVRVTVTSANKKSNMVSLYVTSYKLSATAKEIVFSGEKGEKQTLDIAVTTNVPDFKPVMAAQSDWLAIEGNVLICTQENVTGDTRSANVLINDEKNHFDNVTVQVSQKTLPPVAKEGCVPFKEWPFKKAALSVADKDGDKEVSFEEAMAVKSLDLSGLGLTRTDGLEYFKRIEELNISNNQLDSLVLADPASYSFLRKIDARNNHEKMRYDISGCWKGFYIDIQFDKSAQTEMDVTPHVEYTSVDDSFKGVDLIRKHTKGQGIILEMVTGMCDLDYESGAAISCVEYEIERLFAYEPFTSMREYFDIYHTKWYDDIGLGLVYNLDENGKYLKQAANNGIFGIVIYTQGFFDDRVLAPHTSCFTITKEMRYSINNTIYLQGVPQVHVKNELNDRDCTLAHEMGHAIGGLLDHREQRTKATAPNRTTDLNNLPWQRFLELEKYIGRVGIVEHELVNFPGLKAYTPSDNSIMNQNNEVKKYFDSPCRYALFKNILNISVPGNNFTFTIPDEETWKQFLEYDVINDALPY